MSQRFLGSIKLAVPLLLAIAAVLAWGTFYETRFGTAAVQRFIYQSAWFQGLLAFLGVNLAAAALQRLPWQHRHIPFVLAHLGIILILAGAIVGGRFGVEGQLVIPEGSRSGTLQLTQNVLVVHQPNPGVHLEFPVHFEARAWDHRPHALFEVPLEDRTIRLVVDRYYPNAVRHEEISTSTEGQAENPAVRLAVRHQGQEDAVWLFARDLDRFGAQWGKLHVFFLGRHPPVQSLPPQSILLVADGDRLQAVLTGPSGQHRRIRALRVGKEYVHPWLKIGFEVTQHLPKVRILEQYTPMDNEVRHQVLHLVAQDGTRTAEAWVGLRGAAQLPLREEHPLVVEFRPGARDLPFSVRLLDFRRIDYPGIEMAAGFESDVELTDGERGVLLKRKISMNNPLKYRGYTLFQSSYLQGPVETTVLSVRNDPGTPLVYGGFLIVLAGIMTLFLFRRSVPGTEPASGTRYGVAALLVGLAASSVVAQPAQDQRAALPAVAYQEIRHLAVQHNGRVKPFDSFSWEVLERLTGRPRLEKDRPVETVLSLLSEADRWQEVPLISVPFIPLREKLGLGPKTTHLSYGQLVSDRKLMRMLPAIVEKQQRDEKLSMLENETMDVYDRFVLLTALFQQKVHLVPPEEGHTWARVGPGLQERWERFLEAFRRSDAAALTESARDLARVLRAVNPSAYPAAWRLRLEVIYNDLAPFKAARILYAAGALFMLAFALGRKRGLPGRAGVLLLLAGFLVHGAGIAARVVLGGRPPVSNFYETMLWLPFVGMILAFVFERIYRGGTFGFAGGILAALFLLLADHLPLDPSISPVVAVLRSNLWLTIHVLTIVGSYAPIALAMVLAHLYGLLYLARGRDHPALDSLGLFLYRSIQVGVVLLAAGIMLGAVWANASWGRYWGWDPKETWALITLLWFLAVLHGRFAGWLSGVGVALSTIFGFFLLLMTYYGVSFYLVGLHSYAGGNAKPIPPLLIGYLAAEALFMALVAVRAVRGKSQTA